MYRIGQEEIEALKNVIETRSMFRINSGLQESKKVEETLKTMMGCEYPIFMTSGQAALTSALVGLGVGPGDEVIVPGYTYISTAMAVVAAGAIPIIADIDESLTLDPVDFEAKITKRTKAVMPVHIQGFPSKMDEIMAIAKKYNIGVVEDACQADGGSYRGKRLGTIGNAGAFSFNYYKIISSGEGGALLTSDRKLFEAALIYQDSSAIAYFGNQMEDFTTPQFCGSEFRSNELCAAVIRVQLSRLDDILECNRKNKKYLVEALEDVCCLAPVNDVEGDCATTLAIQFESEEKARKFKEHTGCGLPIDTGKHVYKNWTAIMQKRGAFHPLMDPFKMEANKDIVPDYREDMCQRTLDILSRTCYVGIGPDLTQENLDAKIKGIKEAMAAL